MPLTNRLHEQFAQNYARGGTQAAAYLMAYPASSLRAARVSAPRLLARPEVVARIEEIRLELPPEVEAASKAPPPPAINRDLEASNSGDGTINESEAEAESHWAEGSVDSPPWKTGEPTAVESERPAAGSPGIVFDAVVVDPEARAPSQELTRAEIRDVLSRWGRAQKLVHIWEKLLAVIDARAKDPEMQDVPGGCTGVMTLTHRTVAEGKQKKTVKESRVDTALIGEIRAVMEDLARELGQSFEHRIISQTEMIPAQQGGLDLRYVSTEDLGFLKRIHENAQRRARELAAPPEVAP